MKCPFCGDVIDEELENIFNHLFYQHDDVDTRELLLVTLNCLSQMNLDSYYYKPTSSS